MWVWCTSYSDERIFSLEATITCCGWFGRQQWFKGIWHERWRLNTFSDHVPKTWRPRSECMCMLSDTANLIMVGSNYSDLPVNCWTVSSDFLTALRKWTRRPQVYPCPSRFELQFLLRIILSLQITIHSALLTPNTLWLTQFKLQLMFLPEQL